MKRVSLLGFFCLLLVAAGCDNYENLVPDTKANRDAFEIITGFAPDASVKKIYADADYFGFDPRWSVVCMASPETVKRIVEKREMKKEKEKYACPEFWGPDFPPWMSKEELKKADYYEARVEKDGIMKTLYCLWYIPETRKCQLMVADF